MARNWKDVRKDAVDAGLVDGQAVRNATKLMREEVRAYKLAEVRKRQAVSQQSVADSMGVKQPRVSAIERGELSKTELGTLESYIQALGGHVKVVADFGDESITLRD